jgi:hypothetical protein
MKDLTAETHSKLDAKFAKYSPTAEGDILWLVLTQCAPSYAAVHWPVRTLDKDQCSEILDSDQGVLDLVCQAHERGQYAEIHQLREWQFLHYFQIPDNLPPAKFHVEMSTIQGHINTSER